MPRPLAALALLLAACQAPPEVVPANPVPSRRAGQVIRVAELIEVEGTQTLYLRGYGIVTGLDGTGDSSDSAHLLFRAFPPDVAFALCAGRTAALVTLDAELSPGQKVGDTLRFSVDTVGDAESLSGGRLAFTSLCEGSARVEFAIAGGPLEKG